LLFKSALIGANLQQKSLPLCSPASSVVQDLGFHNCILARKDAGQNTTKLLRELNAERCVLSRYESKLPGMNQW
jgi:hypothetical protein